MAEDLYMIIYKISLCLFMDLTNRQLNIVNIIISHNKVSASKIRTLLPKSISIPILHIEIDKLVNILLNLFNLFEYYISYSTYRIQ